jgi:putative membrane-bound dehydrogenase-like protein
MAGVDLRGRTAKSPDRAKEFLVSSARVAWPLLALLMLSSIAAAGDGNRLAYLDEFCDPYYVGLDVPKLVTPQWIGEPGAEAVIVLSIDDLHDPLRHEAFLRPILDRLKKIDGRAAVSLMTNRTDANHSQLPKWLAEGASLEAHTWDHPCPLLQGGKLGVAKGTYDRSVDFMAGIAKNRPVAFRMPCCDSMSSVSPRFFTEIFNRTTPRGNFLSLDSSVFVLLTADDPDLPRRLVLDRNGQEKFRKYVPTDRVMANLIEDYPYPYVIGRLCWEIPTLMPSDWDAQHLNGVCSPTTVRDLKAAVDAVVIKQGIFSICFHPHGWIRNDQIVEVIDHAVSKHGKKIKFLTFREVYDRLTENLLAGQPLRAADGQDNGVRVLDLDNDGYMDVVIGNRQTQQTRIWFPEKGHFSTSPFPKQLVHADNIGTARDAGIRFGVLRSSGHASFLTRQYVPWHLNGDRWSTRNPNAGALSGGAPSGGALSGTDPAPAEAVRRRGLRLLDVDGDGICEAILRSQGKDWLCRWVPRRETFTLQCTLPEGAEVVNSQGRDAGLRFVDVDEDGRLDLVFSNADRYSLHLFTSMKEGWSRKILGGRRGEKGTTDEIPPVVRADGTNNGAWFALRHMWVQNEDTGGKLPGHVFGRHFTQMLDGDHQPPPRSPQSSLSSILPRPGFKVELVAAEPLVADPIDIAWGPDGKAWVVEMTDYPLGMDEDGHVGLPDPIGTPGGRVRFLEDTNGDGRYDRSTVFLEPVAFPSGVMPWRKGVLVTAAPEIFYAEDTDGDGKADLRKTLFRGFREGNQQHRVNHPRWGLDNWVHAANGDSDGVVRSLETGEETEISGRDLRFRPDEGLIEPQTGRAQFGRNRDDWGNWFGCNNNNPGWHYVLADHYIRRNPHVAAPKGRLDLTASRDAYPGGRVVTHCFYDQPTPAAMGGYGIRTYPPSRGQPGRWTCICGAMIYRDDLFGPAFTSNLFVSDSVYNVIHRMILTPQGVTFRGRRAADEQHSEFLASSDPWFRPATVRTGPDGALWVVDMYRFVIEHPEWIDDRLEKTLQLRRGHDRGRIYRIYPVDKRPRSIPRLDKLDTAGLVAALDSPNGWQRDMAQQMLVWRKDKAAIGPLETMVAGSRRALARLHALCTLDGLAALGAEVLVRALADEHPGVRRHAVRLSESLLGSNPALGKALLNLVEDPDPQVRLQLAYSLGEWDDPRAGRALGRMAVRAADDPYLSAAVMSSATGHVEQMIARVQADPSKAAARAQLLRSLLKLLDAVEADTDATARDREPIRVRAERMLGGKTSAERQATLKKFAAVLKISGDPARGKQVFVEATCSTCHRLDDVGERIGPDLGTLIDRSPENLLVAVIDPNRAFLDRFAEYIAVTDAGLQYSGMLLDETSNSILLVDVDAQQKVILRKDLDELIDTGRSHMPEGLEGKLDLQKMADLFAFVGQKESPRRRFPGNDPRLIRPAADGSLRLAAAHAEIHGTQIALEPKYGNLGLWYSQDGYASWSIQVQRGAAYEVWFDWACADDSAGNRFLLQVRGQTLPGNVPGTGSWDDYHRANFGQVRLEPGQCRLGFRSDGPITGALIDLRAIRLIPVSKGGKAPSKTPGGAEPRPVRPEPDGSLRLRAAAGRGVGPRIEYLPDQKAFGWFTAADRVEWTVEVPQAGHYDAWLEWSVDDRSAGKPFDFRLGETRLIGAAANTGSWETYRRTKIGRMDINAGTQRAVFQPGDRFEGMLLDLREIHLVPAGQGE